MVEELVAAGADEALVEAWIREHGLAMHRVALSIVRDRALAEDVVQDALLRAWRARPGTDVQNERGWLLQIVHNAAVSQLRRERTTSIGDDAIAELDTGGGGDTAEEALAQQGMRDMLEVLAAMDPTTAAILVLRELEDLPYEEIVEVTGLPLPTVKTRLHRGRKELRDRMRGWDR